MNPQKSQGKTLANERSEAAKGGGKRDAQGGRSGGEASKANTGAKPAAGKSGQGSRHMPSK